MTTPPLPAAAAESDTEDVALVAVPDYITPPPREPHFTSAIVAGVVAIGCAIASSVLEIHSPEDVRRYIAWAMVAGFVGAGAWCVQAAGRELQRLAEAKLSGTHPSALRLMVNVVGFLFVGFITLGLAAVSMSSLVVSGAVTGIVVGIAAQQSLGNLFATLMLLLVARPFSVGDRIEVRSGALGGPYEGVVTEIGFTYVSLATEGGMFRLPNAAVLAAATAVLPALPAASDTGDVEPESIDRTA